MMRGPLGYPLNVTVVLADDGHDEQVGKFDMELHTLLFKQKVKLHHVLMRAGNSYSFVVYSKYEIEDIRYVELEWKKRSWTNFFGSWTIHVLHVILDPVYLQDYGARMANTRRLCARKVPVNMWHKEDVDFSYPC